MLDRFGPRMEPGWWAGVVSDLAPLLFLVALIAFGIWAVRRITDQNRILADVALQELRLRYARGDLERDEYVQRLRDLGGQGPEQAPPWPPAPRDTA